MCVRSIWVYFHWRTKIIVFATIFPGIGRVGTAWIRDRVGNWSWRGEDGIRSSVINNDTTVIVLAVVVLAIVVLAIIVLAVIVLVIVVLPIIVQAIIEPDVIVLAIVVPAVVVRAIAAPADTALVIIELAATDVVVPFAPLVVRRYVGDDIITPSALPTTVPGATSLKERKEKRGRKRNKAVVGPTLLPCRRVGRRIAGVGRLDPSIVV